MVVILKLSLYAIIYIMEYIYNIYYIYIHKSELKRLSSDSGLIFLSFDTIYLLESQIIYLNLQQ